MRDVIEKKGIEVRKKFADGQGGKVIEKKWRDVQQIFADRQGRNVIAQNISQQLEYCKDEQQDQKRCHNHGQINKKIPQDVIIQQHWKARAEHASASCRFLKRIFRPA